MIRSCMPVRLTWADHDEHSWLSRLAIIGLGAGTAMAVFGLPPVDIHGPLHYLGIMDPLCGVTRGLRLVLLGHLLQAWRYNPLSVMLVAGAVAAVFRQVLGVAAGRWLSLTVVRRRAVLAISALLAVALEINQQAHAALLRTAGARLPFAWAVAVMAASAVIVLGLLITVWRRNHSGPRAHRHAVAGRAAETGSR